jgi:hypothetical protein
MKGASFLGEVISIYIPKWFKDEGFDELLERFCLSKKQSKSKTMLNIVAGYLDENRNYVDMKITDFEAASVQDVKREIDLKPCFYCGSISFKNDERVHLEGCKLIEMRRKALSSLDGDGFDAV